MIRKTNQMEFMNLDDAGRLQVAFGAVIRLTLILAVSFLLYFLIPVGGFNESNPLAAWIRLSGVTLLFLAVLGLHVRIVLSASVPQVRAVEAVVESVVESVVAFVLLFSLLYLSISTSDPTAFSEQMNRVDALYFTSSTFSTVGFGDIVATSTLTRGLVALQMIAGLGVLGMVAKVSFHAAKLGLNKRP